MTGIWILRRHLLGEYLRWFVFCLAGFQGIATVVDLFEKANSFLKHKATLAQVARYTLFQAPEFLTYMVAPAALMAMLIALAGMTRRNEVTAILAGGIGRRSIVLPMAVMALLLSGGQFLLSEYVVPEANAQKRYVLESEIKGKRYAKVRDKRNRWFYADGGFLRVGTIDRERSTLFGVLYLHPGGAGREPARIEAEAATWDGDARAWKLVGSRLAVADSAGGLRLASDPEAVLPISLVPSDFAAKVSKTEEWPVRELKKILRDRQRLGQDVVKEKVDLHARYALPLAGFVMGLLGAPFAFREHRRGGATTGLVTGIVIAFGYFVILVVGLSLGKNGALPPVVAAWLPNALFGGTGLYLTATLDRL